MLTGLLLLTACSKKRDAPFCFSCEDGRLIEAFDNDLPYTVFINVKGDTLAVIGSFSKAFRKKEGVKVCARLKKHHGIEKAVYMHPTYKVKCVNIKE